MNAPRIRFGILTVLLLLTLAACGGGGGGDGGSGGGSGGGNTQQGGTVIGAAGGTVVGPNGAKVEIPSGALTNDTPILIEQTTAGAPPLPGGFSVSGQMFAFSPHAAIFAVPVTITLPFDPASVPVGSSPALLKTNSQNQFEQVPGATFGMTSVTAQITSFSFAQVVVPSLFRGDPVREWTFSDFRGGNMINAELVSNRQEGGVLEEFQIFGGTFPLFDHEILSISGGVIGQDGKANGQVFSSADGVTYGAFAEAPVGNPNLADSPLGGRSLLRQFQAFIKRSADAKLSFTLTSAFVDLRDDNEGFSRISSNPKCVYLPLLVDGLDACQDIMRGQVILTVKAYTHATSPTAPGRTFFHTAGTAEIFGHREFYRSEVRSSMLSRTPLWNNTDFELALSFPGGAGDRIVDNPEFGVLIDDLTGVVMRFKGPRTYTVDLSGIAVGEEFTLNSTVLAEATNRQGDKSRSVREFPSAAAAFLRDPLSINGTTLAFAGLEPIDNPVLVAPADTPVEPAPCVPGPGPDPEAGVIQFSAANYAIEELSTAAQPVKITRTGGSRGAVTATFRTSDGTAIAGTNYTPVNVSVFFADGDSEARLAEIPIIQSLSIGEARTVNLTLSQPGGCAALGAQSTAVLSIEDTGRPPLPPPPPPTFTIGGTVSGLGGAAVTLVLQLPTTGESITAGDGRFTFTPLATSGDSYAVRIATTPPNVACTLINGTGTVANANVTSVGVDCR